MFVDMPGPEFTFSRRLAGAQNNSPDMQTRRPDSTQSAELPTLEVAQMEAAAYIKYVNGNGRDGSKWKSLSVQS